MEFLNFGHSRNVASPEMMGLLQPLGTISPWCMRNLDVRCAYRDPYDAESLSDGCTPVIVWKILQNFVWKISIAGKSLALRRVRTWHFPPNFCTFFCLIFCWRVSQEFLFYFIFLNQTGCKLICVYNFVFRFLNKTVSCIW